MSAPLTRCAVRLARRQETQNAGKNVPRAIIASYVLGGFLNIGMLVSYLACMNLDNYQYNGDYVGFGEPLATPDNRVAAGVQECNSRRAEPDAVLQPAPPHCAARLTHRRRCCIASRAQATFCSSASPTDSVRTRLLRPPAC